MSILFIDPIVNTSYADTYPIYKSLYKELKKLTPCYLYNKTPKNILEILRICPFSPKTIFFGLGWSNKDRSFSSIKGLNQARQLVIYNLFKPQNYLQKKLFFCKRNNVDLILCAAAEYKKYEKNTKIKTRRLCHAADPSIFKDYGYKRFYDIGFSGALHHSKYYPKGAFSTENLRIKVQEAFSKREDIKCFLRGSDSVSCRITNYKEYAQIMCKSKMWLSIPSAYGDMPPRYFEAWLSKTLLFCSEIPDTYKDIFKDGVNCVVFKNNLKNLFDKFYYYLEHEQQRNAIIETAYKTAIQEHTWRNRAKQVLAYIKEYYAHKK